MDTVLREAKAAHDALVSTASACDNWTSEQWPAKRKEGEAAIKAFHNEFAKLLRYNRSLDLAVTAKKSRDTKDKRNASARSKRVAQKMTERGVPSALADCIASFLEDKPKRRSADPFLPWYLQPPLRQGPLECELPFGFRPQRDELLDR